MRSFSRYGRSGIGPAFLQKGEKTGLDARERQCRRKDHAEVGTHPGCLPGTEALPENPCLGDLSRVANLEVLPKAQLHRPYQDIPGCRKGCLFLPHFALGSVLRYQRALSLPPRG